jgi:hypothetical protein
MFVVDAVLGLHVNDRVMSIELRGEMLQTTLSPDGAPGMLIPVNRRAASLSSPCVWSPISTDNAAFAHLAKFDSLFYFYNSGTIEF